MKILSGLCIAGLWLLSACAPQNNRTPAAPASVERILKLPVPGEDKRAKFKREYEKLIARSDDVDFSTLRLAFTRTPQYQPWDTREHEATRAMFNAYEDEQFELCVRFSEAIFDINPISLGAYFGAMNCLLALEQYTEAAHYRSVVTGLVNSIEQSGDGQSPETAFVSISPTEMRSYLEIKGLIGYRQELVIGVADHIEKIYAIRSSDETYHELYFDNSIAFTGGLL